MLIGKPQAVMIVNTLALMNKAQYGMWLRRAQ
jgi:hypothetical protein